MARIVDANINRAREAVRTLEDLARFALDDSDLTRELKSLRHDLRAAAESLPLDRSALLSSRDTPGDVGTGIQTPAEYKRAGLGGIASAAAGRLTEALRSLEEASKALGGLGATAFESLRYRSYSVEKKLVLALGTGVCPQWRVCVLITESLCTHHRWDRVAELAVAGGAGCLQLREKILDGGELFQRARRLLDIASAGMAHVIVNDRVDVALAAGVQGVHVGQTDLSIAHARAIAGDSLWIGVSTSNLEQARAAVLGGADYCGLGPVFATTTKHKPALVGPEYVARYLADPLLSSRPHLAISGISAENVGALRGVGCRGVAVSGAVCGSRDPEGEVRRIVAGLENPSA